MPSLEDDSGLSRYRCEHLLGECEVVTVAIVSDVYISWLETLCDDCFGVSTESQGHIEDSQWLSRSQRSYALSPLWIKELDDGCEEDARMGRVHGEKSSYIIVKNKNLRAFFLWFSFFFSYNPSHTFLHACFQKNKNIISRLP